MTQTTRLASSVLLEELYSEELYAAMYPSAAGSSGPSKHTPSLQPPIANDPLAATAPPAFPAPPPGLQNISSSNQEGASPVLDDHCWNVGLK